MSAIAKTKKWVREAQKALGLGHWCIEVKFSRSLDARAETSVTEFSQHAVIRFGTVHLLDDEPMQKWTVLHELLHVHTARLCESINAAMHDKELLAQIDQRERNRWWTLWRNRWLR